MDRVSAFNNPEVIRMLQNDFIPAAVDGGMTRRRKDPEGEFYLKFAFTQARYVAAADGTSLAKKTWVPSPHLNRWMKDALARFKKLPDASKRPVVDAGELAKSTRPMAPPGGLVLTEISRLIKGQEVASAANAQCARLPAYDRVWLTHAEWRELLPKGNTKSFEVDKHLVRKLARFHTVDIIGTQRAPWPESSVRDCHLAGEVIRSEGGTVDVRLTGSILIEGSSKPAPNLGPDDGEVKLDLRLAGVLRYDKVRDEITQFDLVAHGPYLKGGRPAKFGFHFRLSGAEAADNVAPWAMDRHHLYGDYPTYYTGK